MNVPIGDIILDPRLQMRVNIDMEAVDDYAENLDKLPPCKIVREDSKMWLTEGWHRCLAHKKAKRETVKCEVREGTFLDALVEAAGANEGHGIRRTPEDKRRAVAGLLETPEWFDKSDNLIAKICKVGPHLVADIRSTVRAHSSKNGDGKKETRTGADGKKRPAGQPRVYCTHCQTIIRKTQEPKKNCPMCKEARKTGKTRPSDKDAATETVDAFGTPIPKRCLDAYCDPWIQKAIDFIGTMVADFWKQRFADGMTKRKRHYPFFVVKDFVDGVGFAGNYLEQLLDHLKANRPAGVCPMCEGKGCADCKLSGLVPRAEYQRLKNGKKQ